MGMNKVISIKYGWNTVAGIKIIHAGHYIQDLLGVKSIPAAKSQNFVDISEAQKSTWAIISEFTFFLSAKTRLYRYCQSKNQVGVTSLLYINLKSKLLLNCIY